MLAAAVASLPLLSLWRKNWQSGVAKSLWSEFSRNHVTIQTVFSVKYTICTVWKLYFRTYCTCFTCAWYCIQKIQYMFLVMAVSKLEYDNSSPFVSPDKIIIELVFLILVTSFQFLFQLQPRFKQRQRRRKRPSTNFGDEKKSKEWHRDSIVYNLQQQI